MRKHYIKAIVNYRKTKGNQNVIPGKSPGKCSNDGRIWQEVNDGGTRQNLHPW